MSNLNKNFILSIPTKLKLVIDNRFKHYNATDLHKIYFLVYKINKEIDYQLHSKNHVHMLSLKNGTELKFIIDGLIDLKIIKASTVANIGVSSNTYRIAQPYNYKQVDCYIKNYYEGQSKIPTWVNRYISDGGTVKGKEFSNYQKGMVEDVSYLRTTILNQKNRIQELEDLNLQLQAELASLKQLNVHNNTKFQIKNQSSTEAKNDVIDDISGLDVFTMKLATKTYYFVNFMVLKSTATDEDDEAILINKLQSARDGDTQCITYNNKNIKFNKVQVDNEIMIELVA